MPPPEKMLISKWIKNLIFPSIFFAIHVLNWGPKKLCARWASMIWDCTWILLLWKLKQGVPTHANFFLPQHHQFPCSEVNCRWHFARAEGSVLSCFFFFFRCRQVVIFQHGTLCTLNGLRPLELDQTWDDSGWTSPSNLFHCSGSRGGIAWWCMVNPQHMFLQEKGCGLLADYLVN